MARRKDDALRVPETPGEAVQLISEYVGDDRRALKVKLACEAAIDKLKAERDVVLAGIEAVQRGRFAALKAWWEVSGKQFAKNRRSGELAGAKIGIRLSTPAVKFAKGVKADAVLAWLQGLRWIGKSRFIRVKTELDRQGIIKHFGEPDVAKAFEGRLSVEQVDEFFIDTQLDEEDVRKEIAAA